MHSDLLKNPFARLVAIAAGLALFAAFPALASAQNLSPTDEQYECGVLGVTGGGGDGGEECNEPKANTTGGNTDDGTDDDSSTVAAAAGDSGDSGSGTLPFTGLDLGAIAAIGVGLLGVGLVLRRTGKSGDASASI